MSKFWHYCFDVLSFYITFARQKDTLIVGKTRKQIVIIKRLLNFNELDLCVESLDTSAKSKLFPF